jgi:hypothetical protein
MRRNLIGTGATRKYLLYAVGEILLVMVGILLALQVNNWNEERKVKIIEQELYENLRTSLRQDSAEIVRILNSLDVSLNSQLLFIKSDFLTLSDSFNIEEMNQLVLQVSNGVFSFFPKYGVYKSIVSNNRIQIVKSEQIKSKLIDLYDYKYKRYENIDFILDQKFAFGFTEFLAREMEFLSSQNKIIQTVEIDKLRANFDELVIQCRQLYRITKAGYLLLVDIHKSIVELITIINDELDI